MISQPTTINGQPEPRPGLEPELDPHLIADPSLSFVAPLFQDQLGLGRKPTGGAVAFPEPDVHLVEPLAVVVVVQVVAVVVDGLVRVVHYEPADSPRETALERDHDGQPVQSGVGGEDRPDVVFHGRSSAAKVVDGRARRPLDLQDPVGPVGRPPAVGIIQGHADDLELVGQALGQRHRRLCLVAILAELSRQLVLDLRNVLF